MARAASLAGSLSHMGYEQPQRVPKEVKWFSGGDRHLPVGHAAPQHLPNEALKDDVDRKSKPYASAQQAHLAIQAFVRFFFE